MIPKTIPTVAPAFASVPLAAAEFALTTIGAVVGANVTGAVVGTVVGAFDGAFVGTVVGAFDGAVVGAPVHAVGLHSREATPKPLQSAPVPTGAGFEHNRVSVPPPHATEHAAHVV